MKKTDDELIADIKDFAEVAAIITERGEEDFLDGGPDGLVLRYAARNVIVNVSSAADRFTDQFREEHKTVPWRAIHDMRNRVAHDYEGVNDDLVWDAIAHDIPELIRQLTGASPGARADLS